MYRNEAVKSYAVPPTPGNAREVEAWAMTQASLRMKDAQQAEDRKAMVDAARLNWRLWTIIQADLLEPNCPLPVDVRSNVLSLANFVDKHTVKFLSRPNASMLDVLININREIASGLYAQPQQADVLAAPAQPALGMTKTSA